MKNYYIYTLTIFIMTALQTEFLTITSDELSAGYSHDFLYNFKFSRYHNIKKIVLEKAIIPKTFFVIPTTKPATISPYYKEDGWDLTDFRWLNIQEQSSSPGGMSVQIPVGNYSEKEMTDLLSELLTDYSSLFGASCIYTVVVDSATGYLKISATEAGAPINTQFLGSSDTILSKILGFIPGVTTPNAFSTYGVYVVNLHGPTLVYLNMSIPRYDKLDKLAFSAALGQSFTYAIPMVAGKRQFFAYQSSDFTPLRVEQQDSIEGIMQLRFTLKHANGDGLDLRGGNVTYIIKIVTESGRK